MAPTTVDNEAGPQDAPTETGWKATVQAGLAYIFVGDWHPVVRDPLDVFRLSFSEARRAYSRSPAASRARAG